MASLILRPAHLQAEAATPDQSPGVIRRVEPIYPPFAEEMGVDGKVIVRALIGTDGTVRDTKVVRSIPMLDGAAVQAVRQWVFKPKVDPHGKPVEAWIAVPITFTVDPIPRDSLDKKLNGLRKLISRLPYPNALHAALPSAQDAAAREEVIRLAHRVRLSTTFDRESLDEWNTARAMLRSSSVDTAQFGREVLAGVLYMKPWLAEPYLDAARELEKQGLRNDAAAALQLFLICEPFYEEREVIEKRIAKLLDSGH